MVIVGQRFELAVMSIEGRPIVRVREGHVGTHLQWSMAPESEEKQGTYACRNELAVPAI